MAGLPERGVGRRGRGGLRARSAWRASWAPPARGRSEVRMRGPERVASPQAPCRRLVSFCSGPRRGRLVQDPGVLASG